MKIIEKTKKAGFTLLEMLLALGIFGMLTAVVIFNYGDFNSQVLLTNMAYEMGLQIREAQVYSLGVRTRGAGETDFQTNFGFHVHPAYSNKSFIFFSDKEPRDAICSSEDETFCDNCVTGQDECIARNDFTRNVVIEKVCLANDADPVNLDTGVCNSSTQGFDMEKDVLTITFQRPNPEAMINSFDENGSSISTDVASAAVVIVAPNGMRRAVIVYNTGQISVESLKDE